MAAGHGGCVGGFVVSKTYDRMTPEEQRAFDERDLAILRMRARGSTYAEIRAAVGVSDPTIRKVLREHSR